jgi:DTW domain-containing protein YfiP
MLVSVFMSFVALDKFETKFDAKTLLLHFHHFNEKNSQNNTTTKLQKRVDQKNGCPQG